MPILNRPVNSSGELEGIEYTGRTYTALKKNQLCYYRYSNGAFYSNKPVRLSIYSSPSWLKLDDDRVLLIVLNPTTTTTSMYGYILTFDSSGNFIVNTEFPIRKNDIPLMQNQEVSLCKLINKQNREIVVCAYGRALIYIEILDKLTISHLLSTTIQETSVTNDDYIEIHQLPTDNNSDNDGYFLYVSYNVSQRMTRCYVCGVSLKNESQTTILSKEVLTPYYTTTTKLLRIIPFFSECDKKNNINNQNFMIVYAINYNGNTICLFRNLRIVFSTSNVYYSILSDNYREITLDNIFVMKSMSCSYNLEDEMITIVGNVTASPNPTTVNAYVFFIGLTFQFYFTVSLYNKFTYTSSGYIGSAQGIILHGYLGFMLCSGNDSSVATNNFVLVTKSDSENEWLVKNDILNTNVSFSKHCVPIVRGNTVYFCFMQSGISRPVVHYYKFFMNTIIISQLTSPNISSNYIGLAKKDYARNTISATIIHPTTK